LDQFKNQDVIIDKFTVFEHERETVFSNVKKAVLNMKDTISHENLVQYLGCYKSESGIDIVVQHCKGGDLFTILHDERLILPIDFRMKLLLDIARGMEYLHANEILHNDLKSKNVLLYDKLDKRAMISNYGIAFIFQNTDTFQAFSKNEDETVRFKAPEILSYGKFSKKSDIYAFGILMWEVFSRRVPFDVMKKEEIVNYIVDKGRPDIGHLDPGTPPIVTFILIHCWEEDVEKRCSFTEIVHSIEKYFE
jgi:serine/threonine protein kinase